MKNSPAMDSVYKSLYQKYETSNSQEELKELGVLFKSLDDSKEAKKYALLCFKKAEECRKSEIYNKAIEFCKMNTVGSYNKAISELYSIHPYKDTGKLIKDCDRRIYKLKMKHNNEMLERQAQLSKKKANPFSDTAKIIIIGIVLVIISIIALNIWYALPY